MTDKTTTLEQIQELDNDLVKMVDSFAKLIKASKYHTDTLPSGSAPVPGELFAVLVEKLVHRSEIALQRVRDLKTSMTLHNVSDVLAKVKKSSAKLELYKLQTDASILKGKGSVAARLKSLLTLLEEHYYSSQPGYVSIPAGQADTELDELCKQALNAPFEM